ncbi:polyketide cyclase [Aliidiomarina sedimenti]|uniref:Polyketide cyclase n=1 Tax=Aliidiomarina sedimenti TaxID=1933879 RepID=A0ABY0C067_9GAMM|nr:SRPBCC family protein [Aliidiomarina sedimenti]RUO30747.1 polyketide cyclase [Aliidiomarina sedimenti]
MSVDFGAYLGKVTHSVAVLERDGKPARGVTLERDFKTTLEDLWDAITNPERLPRWFLPVSGELKHGGHYQLEGNAGGTITECTAPRSLALTWEFGGGVSWVEVTLTPLDEQSSHLKLVHICPLDEEFWPTYGPGATGVGWDLGLVGLAVHLESEGGERFDEEALTKTADGRAFITALSHNWGEAAVEAGDNEQEARLAAEKTAAFYSGE